MPTTIPVASPAIAIVSPAIDIWDKVLAIVSNRDFIVAAAFSTVGILLTILFVAYLMPRFPDVGALIEQYNQF
jgi:hypothetical protein